VYFGLARVLAFPPANERVLTPSDAHALATRTAALLKPAPAAAAAFAAPRLLPRALAFGSAARLARNGFVDAAAPGAATAGAERPASAAAVRSVAQAWLLGVAAQPLLRAYASPADAEAAAATAAATGPSGGGVSGRSGDGAGAFYLAWPPRTAFDPALSSAAGADGSSGASLWRHGGAAARWGTLGTGVYGVVTGEAVSPALDRFDCNVTVFEAGPAAAGAERGASSGSGAAPVAAASLVLRASYHPGWRCAVTTRSASEAQVEVAVGEVVPGFMFVDLPAGAHAVRCAYHPAPLKGALLAAAGATLAALAGLTAAAAVIGV
jgi:hypothetical protein